jgi:hypothetical protein
MLQYYSSVAVFCVIVLCDDVMSTGRNILQLTESYRLRTQGVKYYSRNNNTVYIICYLLTLSLVIILFIFNVRVYILHAVVEVIHNA